MATVVFDNNEGAGDGKWSTATNWIGDALPGDADTAQISADCTMDVSDVVAALIVDSGKTLTLTAGVSLTGLKSTCTINGSWILNAGCTVSADLNGLVLIAHGSASYLEVNGTEANPVTITNANAGGSAQVEIRDPTVAVCSWLTVPKARSAFDNTTNACTAWKLSDCDLQGAGSSLDGLRIGKLVSKIILERTYISNFSQSNRGGINVVSGTQIEMDGCVLGKNRNGDSLPNTSDIRTFSTAVTVIAASNTQLLSSTQFAEATPGRCIYAANSHQASAGASYWRDSSVGTIERSTTNPPSGKTYHARLTPVSTNGSNSRYLEFSIYIPVQSGDNISVTAKASRSGDSSDCADVVIDPEGAWFTPTAVAWDLTNADTYYDLPTCAATGAGGTGAKGTVRVVFRMKEYSASQYLDIGDITITCGGVEHKVSCQNWANGMPVVDNYPDTSQLASLASTVWAYGKRTLTR